MPKLQQLTIAILTHHRNRHLSNCLSSIYRQSYLPYKIIIIDNSLRFYAKNTVNHYQKKLSITYLRQPIKNISRSRNLAIDRCPTKYLAFIDDDCQLRQDWSDKVVHALKNYPNLSFYQGNSIPKPPSIPIVQAQNNLYQQWLKQNSTQTSYHPTGIDTKNIILNLKKINPQKQNFDPNFPIFEDTDFGLQLAKSNLHGRFFADITVIHQEISSFPKLISKYFYRGKVKYYLNTKWSDFDHFEPKIKNIARYFFHQLKITQKFQIAFFQTLFQLSFNLGFIIAKKQRYSPTENSIFVVNIHDKAANEERAIEIGKFLKDHQFQVNLLDSQKLFDQTINNLKNGPKHFPLFYLYRLTRFTRYKLNLPPLDGWLFIQEIILRQQIIKNILNQERAKIVIAQYPKDITIAFKPRRFNIILDLPTIYSQELLLGHQLPKFVPPIYHQYEVQAFRETDSITFHWKTFLSLAKSLKYSLHHQFIMNWGTSSPPRTSTFSLHPKIIYLGNLNSDWINQKLLENIYQNIIIPFDVYSYDQPQSPSYQKLKVHGYLNDLSTVSRYQFGLITITNDLLRNQGFSAKHLLYFSYGLPVFCPEWRYDPTLAPGTIYYNQQNLNSLISKYSQKKYWLVKHFNALKIAKELSWSSTLKPLLEQIAVISYHSNF